MILAAGLGQRMRPLTDNTPKPLLCAGNKPLIDYHLESLASAGVTEAIINLAYLGDKIRAYCGDGSRYGIQISYSDEPEPLETAGAINNALELLGDIPFVLVNGDVWSDYPITQLVNHSLESNVLAHLVMVDNPDFHPEGDFGLNSQGRITLSPPSPHLTFSGISIINPALISLYPEKRTKFPLGEVFRWAIAQEQITGEHYQGQWSDVGTPARLEQLDTRLKNQG